ncbi:MAG TPA: hypothetical protein V6C57_01295 [Coleofasciculaceae cyanobacterium]
MLRTIAQERDKTVTQLVEDWIDRLPTPSSIDAIEPAQPTKI